MKKIESIILKWQKEKSPFYIVYMVLLVALTIVLLVILCDKIYDIGREIGTALAK